MLQGKLKFALLIGLIILNLDGACAQPNDSDQPYNWEKVYPSNKPEQSDFDKQANSLDKQAMEYIKSQPNQEELLKVWRSTQYAFGGTPVLRDVRNQADKEDNLANIAFQKEDYLNALPHYMHSIAYFEVQCKTGAMNELKPTIRSVTSINDCLDCLRSLIHLYHVDVDPRICSTAVIRLAEKLFYLGFIEDHLGNHSQADRLYIGAFPYISLGSYPGIPAGPLGGAEAQNQLKFCLAQVESKCGLKSPSTAIRAEMLADFYCHGGKYSEAEKLYNQAIAIRQKVKNADSSYFLSHDLSNLSMCLSRQHKDSSSISSQLPLVQERAYGKDSLAAAYAWYKAGISTMNKHDYLTAESQLSRAISIFEKLELKTWPRKNMDLPGYKGQLNTCRQWLRNPSKIPVR